MKRHAIVSRDTIRNGPDGEQLSRPRLLLAALMAACLLLVASASARAATFTVDRNDDPDPATSSACTAAPADCSLRGAIVAANAAAGADAITVQAATYTLTRAGADEDAASTGDLDVTDELTITGAGARATIVAGGPAPFDDRIFDNQPGAKTTIGGLSIVGGKSTFVGGVYNRGDLKLEWVAVKNNTTSNDGGGIYGNGGSLSITNSTVSGNSAMVAGGLRQNDGTATIVNSTITGNKADQFGGGIVAVGSVINVRNSTITSNDSGRLGGGILTTIGATVLVKNTIVAGNSIDNCDTAQLGGAIASQGNNLSSDGSCLFTMPGDRRNVSPRLGPLQDNGGPTDTRALLAGSPALDAGAITGCPAADQRGVARPQGLRCDIGAFERVNRPPVARNDAYRGKEDTLLSVSPRGVLRNDTDPNGDSLRARVVRRPAKGRLTLNPNGSFSYRPPRNFNGRVSFAYRASDGRGASDTATVTIRIAARPG